MVFKKKRVWHCLPGQEPTELDKKVMYWENKGKTVPSRSLIKTPEQIEGIRMAQCDMARINTLTWAIEQQAEVLLLAARVEMRGAA